METERLRQAQMQAERLLDSRERANRQKVKGMEETVRYFLFIFFILHHNSAKIMFLCSL